MAFCSWPLSLSPSPGFGCVYCSRESHSHRDAAPFIGWHLFSVSGCRRVFYQGDQGQWEGKAMSRAGRGPGLAADLLGWQSRVGTEVTGQVGNGPGRGLSAVLLVPPCPAAMCSGSWTQGSSQWPCPPPATALFSGGGDHSTRKEVTP